jgi:hypothetical protein
LPPLRPLEPLALLGRGIEVKIPQCPRIQPACRIDAGADVKALQSLRDTEFGHAIDRAVNIALLDLAANVWERGVNRILVLRSGVIELTDSRPARRPLAKCHATDRTVVPQFELPGRGSASV